MTARTRSQNVSNVPIGRYPKYITVPSDGSTGSILNWTTAPVGRFDLPIEQMSDVVGEPGINHPVHHFKISGYLSSFPDWGHNYDNGGGHNLEDFCFFPIDSFDGQYGAVTKWPWLPDMLHSSWISDCAVEAYTDFNDQVPTAVSIPNFLYELKDMKGMIPSINRSSLTKTASNNFLAFEFGVKPFISDIKAMINMFDAVEKRINHLLSVNGRSTNLTYKKELVQEEPYSFFRGIDGYGTSYGSCDGVMFTRQSVRTNLVIKAKLDQDLSDLQDAMRTMKALAAAGGFNKPARVIWNAIPYSFVVDWFFHVGKLLDSLSVQPFGGTYKVSEVWYSVKNEASYLAVAHNINDTTYPVKGNPLMGSVKVKSYDRVPGFPMSSLFLTSGAISPKQQVLALAMLEQRRR